MHMEGELQASQFRRNFYGRSGEVGTWILDSQITNQKQIASKSCRKALNKANNSKFWQPQEVISITLEKFEMGSTPCIYSFI